MVLSKAKDYYKNNKDRLREQARDKYKNLFEEEKNIKEIMKKIDITRCLKKKARLKEYQKNYYEAKKSQHIIINNDLIVF